MVDLRRVEVQDPALQGDLAALDGGFARSARAVSPAEPGDGSAVKQRERLDGGGRHRW